MAAHVDVEVIGVEPNITIRPVSSENAVNWAAEKCAMHPGDVRVFIPLSTLQQMLSLLADMVKRLR